MVLKHAERLRRFHPGVIDCHVTIELPHQHHHQGNHYRVHVELSVPGGSLTVTRGNGENRSHEDLHVVLREAFQATVRRLEDRLRKPRAQRHAEPQLGGRGAGEQ